ncbi:alpha/beta fold hydrolase [Egibacter rhizosphaerae]|uniref:Alpha/beta fold hydrolase n=1 Tax=Egibacter rhizosphaerae TaxID=1670831 RepID=A0A411YJN4_9ACTN|nr:alpha/beta fold hydrolase [Egibacter rhizosphaerae]QBI21376.1 alpha/beta fold hydrolase [Egibacter rhizosphaerae]
MGQVIPGAESWSAGGGEHGALVLHGFVGNPVSVRPLAEALADAGFAVELPRLPGHGTTAAELNRTRWTDWAREASAALDLLAARTTRRVVVGQSMGGALALHLAGARPDLVHGIAVINPFLSMADRRLAVLPVLKRLVPSLQFGVGDDIAKSGVSEYAYPRVPLRALDSVRELHRQLDLARVAQPILVLTSARDNTVDTADSQRVLDGVGSVDREQVVLQDSYHVATLDHDADLINARVTDFAKRVCDG